MAVTESKTLIRDTETGPAREILIPEFCDSETVYSRTGLSRSYLYLLENEGKIESVSLRRAGTTRGKRLWHLPSILSYLKGLMEGAKK